MNNFKVLEDGGSILRAEATETSSILRLLSQEMETELLKGHHESFTLSHFLHQRERLNAVQPAGTNSAYLNVNCSWSTDLMKPGGHVPTKSGRCSSFCGFSRDIHDSKNLQFIRTAYETLSQFAFEPSFVHISYIRVNPAGSEPQDTWSLVGVDFERFGFSDNSMVLVYSQRGNQIYATNQGVDDQTTHQPLFSSIHSTPQLCLVHVECAKKTKLSMRKLKEQIRDRETSLSVCKLCHYAGGPNKLFSMPVRVCYLSTHSARELHQVVYRRIHAWIGTTGDVLSVPPDSDDDAQWDTLLAEDALPYRLCYKDSQNIENNMMQSLSTSGNDAMPSELATRRDTSLRIDWSSDAFALLQDMMNKVAVDAEYAKWKKERYNSKRKNLTLYDCLDSYVSKETLDEGDAWYCPKCKKHQEVIRKLDLWSFPEILVVHLKRFQDKKISTFVDCPIRGLDLTPYNESKQEAPVYDLFAVSCHSGPVVDGYNTTYALNAETERWFYFNDSSVKPAFQSDIISQATHVLFYKRQEVSRF